MPSRHLIAVACAAAAAAWLSPSLAAAATYPTAVWPSEYQRLSRLPGTAQNLRLVRNQLPDGDLGEARNVQLPFTFRFHDAAFTAVHVGANGYLTFGGPDADTSAARTLPDYLLRTAAPKNLVAAWWGDHFCNADGGVRSKVLGTAPHREFAIEWDTCSKKHSATDGTATTFQAQIRLLEGSDVIRVHYGTIEVDPAARWENLSWGLKGPTGVGVLGPDVNGGANACDPVLPQGPNRCREEHFPAGSVIQYGRSPDADVTGRMKPGPIEVEATTIALDLETILINAGASPLQGVGYDLYLATSPGLAPGEPGTFALGSHAAIEDLSGGESRSVADRFTAARPPNGLYRLCALFDPAQTLAERDRSNNRVCSRTMVPIGPDLVVTSIAGPAGGEPGGAATLSLEIRNAGNYAAGAFGYRVVMKPVVGPGDQGMPTETLLTGRVTAGLAVGASYQTTVNATLPPLIRAEAYLFELQLDPAGEVPESDRSNNAGVSGQMHNRRPQLMITQPVDFSLPDGCYFGEAVEATYEVCNTGESVARNFHVGVSMGDGSQPNAAIDPTAAAFPPYCGVPGSWDYAACAPLAGREPSCAFEFCRLACASDADCGSTGLVCREDPLLAQHLEQESAKSCMNELRAAPAPRTERCRTFTLRGRIPFTDQLGTGYQESLQRFHLLDDALHELSSGAPSILSTAELLCRPALLDLAVDELQLPKRLVRGKIVPISRRIRNLGFTNFVPGTFLHNESETFEVRYFLSATPEVSIRQIPLPIVSAGMAATVTIDRKGIDVGTDWVSIPSWVEPGTYHLGILLDPLDLLEEIDEDNNAAVFGELVTVTDDGLEIREEALPRALVGAGYRHSFVATGGTGRYAWSGENLPPGLSLSDRGLLQGVPTDAGTYAFTVGVSAGGMQVEKVVALQVLEGMSALEVATRILPVAVKGAPYGSYYDAVAGKTVQGVRLAAGGGRAPYRWELDPLVPDNRLPEGLLGPTEDGVIAGSATPMSQTRSIAVRVTDSLGNQARASLEITVLDGGALVVRGTSFELATSGEDYESCIEAQGGDGSFGWYVASGSLPPGVEGEARGAQLCLIGIPSDCGNYDVPVRVGDGQGQSRSATIPLSVECGVIQLTSRAVRPVQPGETISFQLGAIPSDSPVFRVTKGSLPRGLGLSEGGRIAGTVAEDAPARPYDLLVELRDGAGRRSLGALTIQVVADAPTPRVVTESKSGCSSTGAGRGWLALLGASLGIVSLRRSRGARSWDPVGVARSVSARGAGVGLGLFVVLAAFACGGGSETRTLSLCEEVSCDAGSTCDEADGRCKCGGVVCAEDDRCSPGPTPACVSPACEFVSCERGQSCDAETGECRCGPSACDEGERCEREECVAIDRCDGVDCGEGASCDPADGLCRCGGAVCAEGARCVEGACTIDRCFGVQCAAHSTCNPEDGACHCGEATGAICSTGEACLAAEGGFACQISTLCDGVHCGGGTVCDPDDGACRCGGVGTAHPICEAGQGCFEGACVGGDLCAPGGVPLACAPGLACDPLDGVCKCGGKRGTVCGEGESCSLFAGELRCMQRCTLLERPTTCPTGESCYYEQKQSSSAAFCAPTGAGLLGERCDFSNQCGLDLHCSPLGVCVQTCDASGGPEFCRTVGPELQCVPFSFGETLGYCRNF